MTMLKTRPYLGKSDFRAIAELVNTCDSVGQLDKDKSVVDLEMQLEDPFLEPLKDVRLWENDEGKLIGFGQIYRTNAQQAIDGYLYFFVHPETLCHHLESQIIDWSEKRMLELHYQQQIAVNLRSNSRHDLWQRCSVLEQHDFTIDRSFLTMSRTLNEPFLLPQLPDGFVLRPLEVDRELPAWVDCFNESFIDHWNHHELTLTTAEFWLNEPSYRPDLNLVIVAPNGKIAAFAYASICPEQNHRLGTQEGWINWLGTSRYFRRMGLGKAVLLGSMQALQMAGMDTVKLAVDADSLTGATRLYESVGFEPVQTWLSYLKPLL